MRAVEDHHVDRPGVEAWQHVKLTGTNRSIGLISVAGKTAQQSLITTQYQTRAPVFDDLVAMARGNTPDPIPNSAVKTLSADGTAS